MAKEKPLDLEQFFLTRNEIAQKHNDRLELQAVTRIRENMFVKSQEEVKQAVSKPKEKGDK